MRQSCRGASRAGYEHATTAAKRSFAADGVAEPWITRRRREALERLALTHRARNGASAAWSDAVYSGFSDLRFTDANRVPFPFARLLRDTFNLTAVVVESSGPRLHDLDGNWSLDVSGSVQASMWPVSTATRRGSNKAGSWWTDLGPVLGPVHPIVARNIALLTFIQSVPATSSAMPSASSPHVTRRLRKRADAWGHHTHELCRGGTAAAKKL